MPQMRKLEPQRSLLDGPVRLVSRITKNCVVLPPQSNELEELRESVSNAYQGRTRRLRSRSLNKDLSTICQSLNTGAVSSIGMIVSRPRRKSS